MEGLLDTQHGTTVLLAGIIIVSCLHLLAKVGEMLLKRYEKKQESSDKSITEMSLAFTQLKDAVRDLGVQHNFLEREIREITKFRHDLNTVFAAVKKLAGPKWPKIKKEITDEDIQK